MPKHHGVDRGGVNRYEGGVRGGIPTTSDKETNDLQISFPDLNSSAVMALALATSICTSCQGPTRKVETTKVSETVPASDTSDSPPTDADRVLDRPHKRWHMDLGIRNSFPKLDSTEKQLDLRMDLPLKLDILGVFDRPYTPVDRRSDQGYQSLFAGFGRQENPRFLWTYYFGGSSGKDINHGRFLIETLEVDFKYNFYYTGISAEYYPWKVPTIHATPTWEERLLASRPYLLTGLETGYVSSEGEGDLAIAGLTVYHDELKIRDWLFGCYIGLGWDLPLNDRWSINVSSDYDFHFYRAEEYNGWNVTIGTRYRF